MIIEQVSVIIKEVVRKKNISLNFQLKTPSGSPGKSQFELFT